MKELFLKLLSELQCYGNLTSANMYEDGKYSALKIENEEGQFAISITKMEDKNNVN